MKFEGSGSKSADFFDFSPLKIIFVTRSSMKPKPEKGEQEAMKRSLDEEIEWAKKEIWELKKRADILYIEKTKNL